MDADWFKDLQKKRGVTSYDLGARLGRDRTIVARIYAGRQKLTLPQAQVFAEMLDVPLHEVIERAGVSVPGLEFRGSGGAAQQGFSESDAIFWHPGEKDDPSADRIIQRQLGGDRAGVDTWIVQSRAMALAGYLPGDKILVDTNKSDRAKPGDVVIAQVYDASTASARTVLRRFQRPALVAHSADPPDWTVFIVDDTNVAIRGIVSASWRIPN